MKGKKMRALVHDKTGNTKVLEVENPTVGPGEVLIEVAAAGLCGTDRHIADGTHGSSSRGIVLGHEVSGVIRSVGDGVDQQRIGQVVCIEPNIVCGECDQCRAGYINLCQRLEAIGVTRDGGLAPTVSVPAELAICVPEGLSATHAVLGEPLSCVVRAVDIAAPKAGSRAAVWGLGTAGLMMIQYLKFLGVEEVIAISHHESHRERAIAAGATEARHRDEAEGLVVDLAIEASGSPAAFAAAYRSLAPKGTLLVYGVMNPDDVVGIEPENMFRNELTIRGSYVGIGAVPRALELLAQGAVDPEVILGDEMSLEEAAAWVHRSSTKNKAKNYVRFVVEG